MTDFGSDFGLSEEQRELRDTVRRFAQDKVSPVVGDYYERHEFPSDLVRQMGAMGLFGLPFPASVAATDGSAIELGGMDGDYLALCLVLE